MNKKSIVSVLAVILLVILPVVSFAAEFRAGEQTSVGVNENITNDVYIAGGSVNSAGNINGDLITAGGNVVVSGDVSADLMAGGGNVSILSNVGDDLRVGGGTVVVMGKVGGDVMAGGGQVTLGGVGVGGDVAIGGGNVRIDAPVTGDLFVAGGNVYINAPIGGNVKIQADKITLGSSAVISGDLTYKSGEAMVKEAGAVVNGKIDFEVKEKKMFSAGVIFGIIATFVLGKFLALLACALIIGVFLFRRWSKEILVLATKRTWFEMGRGVVAFVVLPVVSVIFLVTIIGIPIGIFGLLSFIILMLVSWVVSPIILGSVAYRYFSKKELEISWKTVFLGVFLYTLLGIVPFFGSLAQMLLMFLALGSIVALKLQIIKEWR